MECTAREKELLHKAKVDPVSNPLLSAYLLGLLRRREEADRAEYGSKFVCPVCGLKFRKRDASPFCSSHCMKLYTRLLEPKERHREPLYSHFIMPLEQGVVRK